MNGALNWMNTKLLEVVVECVVVKNDQNPGLGTLQTASDREVKIGMSKSCISL